VGQKGEVSSNAVAALCVAERILVVCRDSAYRGPLHVAQSQVLRRDWADCQLEWHYCRVTGAHWRTCGTERLTSSIPVLLIYCVFESNWWALVTSRSSLYEGLGTVVPDRESRRPHRLVDATPAPARIKLLAHPKMQRSVASSRGQAQLGAGSRQFYGLKQLKGARLAAPMQVRCAGS
jgi:hypothetical protein